MPTVPLLCACSPNYSIAVQVYNNTGANATLTAWLDYNANGVFDAAEGRTVTVSTSASMQTINVPWTGIVTPLRDNQITYLRVRLTSATNSMTTANPTGWFANGEVEDYRVVVDGYPLDVNLLTFEARKTEENKAQITWKVSEDATASHYFVQRSRNNRDWVNIETKKASAANSVANYSSNDTQSQNGLVYYRLESVNRSGQSKLSEVRRLNFGLNTQFTLAPNPVSDRSALTVTVSGSEHSTLFVRNASGSVVHSQPVQLTKGSNTIELTVGCLPAGVYNLQMSTESGQIMQQFVKK